MNKTYHQALDAMTFPEETTDRMTNDLARAIAERQKHAACETTTASCEPTPPADARCDSRSAGGS